MDNLELQIIEMLIGKENLEGEPGEELLRSVFEKVGDHLVSAETLALVGRALKSSELKAELVKLMIRTFKQQFANDNADEFKSGVKAYAFLMHGIDYAVRDTLKIQATDFSQFLDRLRNPEILKLVLDTIQISPANGLTLLKSTTGMDDLIVDAMHLNKGFIEIEKQRKVLDRTFRIYSKKPLRELLIVTLEKDKTGRLFRKISEDILKCESLDETSLQVSDLLEIRAHHQSLRSISSETEEFDPVIAIISSLEDNLIKTYDERARKRNILNMAGVIYEPAERCPISYSDFKLLHDNLCKKIVEYEMFYLSRELGETMSLVHDELYHEKGIDKEMIASILSATLARHESSNLGKADLSSFLVYAENHGRYFTAEDMGDYANLYIKALLSEYTEALDTENNHLKSLCEKQIIREIEETSHGFFKENQALLQSSLPQRFLRHTRFRKLEITSEMGM